MLTASQVEILLSAADLQSALLAYSAGRADEVAVRLEEGAALVSLKVRSERLPMALTVQLRLTVSRVYDRSLEVQVAWVNMPLLPGFLKELALEKAFEAMPGTYRDGLLVLDLAEVLDETPVSFQVVGLRIAADGARIALRDVELYPLNAYELLDPVPTALVPVPSTEEAQIPEHQDYYTKLRQRIAGFAAEKAPKWAQPLVPWVLAAPDFFVLCVRLARDERVPAMAKVITGVTIAYFIMPIDLIPDIVPIVGEVDDLAVALFALEQVAARVSPELIEEHWPGEGKVLDLVAEGTKLVSRVLPEKMLTSIRRLLTRS